jgi:hypothetical protein
MFDALTRAPWYGGSLSMNVGGAGRKKQKLVLTTYNFMICVFV